MLEDTVRAPGEANLRTPIVRAAFVKIPAYAYGSSSQRIRSSAYDCNAEVSELFVNWAKVLPAQAQIEREVGFHFNVILKKAGITVGANVVPGLSQFSR